MHAIIGDMLSETSLMSWAHHQLGDTPPISADPNPDARVGIIVPAYGEDPDSPQFKRLIDSIASQAAPPGSLELFVVVNNGPPPEEPEKLGVWRETVELNKLMLEYLQSDAVADQIGETVPVHVIDKSSAGNEIPECNVGKARQINLAAAVLCFAQQGLDPIMQVTDADSYPKRKDFMGTLMGYYDDPRLVGMVQPIAFEMREREYTPDAWANLEPYLDTLFDALRARRLLGFIAGKVTEHAAIGINFSGRMSAIAAVDGFPPVNFGEDNQLGDRLRAYAAQIGGHVLTSKHDPRLVVGSDYRESERTGSSFHELLETIRQGEIPTQVHPLTNENVPLTAETYVGLWDEVAAITHAGPNGPETGDEMRRYLAHFAQVNIMYGR